MYLRIALSVLHYLYDKQYTGSAACLVFPACFHGNCTYPAARKPIAICVNMLLQEFGISIGGKPPRLRFASPASHLVSALLRLGAFCRLMKAKTGNHVREQAPTRFPVFTFALLVT